MTILINQEETEDALTSDNRMHRILARGALSEFLPKMMDWAADELRRPKSRPVDVMQASLHLYLGLLASVAAQSLRPGGEVPLVELVVGDVRRLLPKAIEDTRVALSSKRKEEMQ